MKKMELYLFSIVLIIFLSACSNSSTIPTQALITSSDINSAYPPQQAEYPSDPSYPGPTSPVAISPFPTPTMDPQLGYASGRLLLNNKPVNGMTLDLAEVIVDKSGNDIVAGLDRVNSPSVVTDNQGRFAFINIKAGRYALILDLITSQFLLSYPGREDPIIIQVEVGKTVDLGDLNFSELPIP